MDRRRLKERERGVYSHTYNKHNKTNILSAKRSRESLQIAEYPLHQLIRLRHVNHPYRFFKFQHRCQRILAQGYCVAIISLSLL